MLISVVGAALLAALATVELWTPLGRVPALGERAPVTARLGSAIVARGTRIGPDQRELVQILGARARLGGLAPVALGAGLLVATALLTSLALGARRGARPAAVAVGAVVAGAAAAQAALLASALHVLALPVAALGMALVVRLGRPIGMGAALAAAVAVVALGPVEPVVAAALLAQAVVGALAARPGAPMLLGGVLAGAASSAVMLAGLALAGVDPQVALADPLRSPVLAAAIGGVLAGPLALALAPLLGGLLGGWSGRKLRGLADPGHPMWAQKSADLVARAKELGDLSAVAARRIDADVDLTRVGAWAFVLAPANAPPELAAFVQINAPGTPLTSREVALVAFGHETLTELAGGPRETGSIHAAASRASSWLIDSGRLDDSGLSFPALRAARHVIEQALEKPPTAPPPSANANANANVSVPAPVPAPVSVPAPVFSPAVAEEERVTAPRTAVQPPALATGTPAHPRTTTALGSQSQIPRAHPPPLKTSQPRLATPSGSVAVVDEDVVAVISTDITGPTPLEVPLESKPKPESSQPPALRKR